MLLRRCLAAAATMSLLTPAFADTKAKQPDPARAYDRMVEKVANMTGDDRAYTMASSQGLSLLNVMWEDTGRWEGSSVGPNISDVTIEVEGYNQGKTHHTYLMPVMRYENFSDKTADLKIDKIIIPVGNQRENGKLELISLKELLESPEQYMSTRDKGKFKG